MSHGNAVRSPVGQTAVQYLLKYKRYPLRTIARLMFEAEPKLFRDMEHARSTLRSYAGQRGTAKRREMEDKSLFREAGHQSDSLERLPEPLREDDPWQVEKLENAKTVGWISDVHVPFHDKEAVIIALRHLKKVGVDTIVCGGDLFDFYAASKFEKDPRLRNFPNELNIGREFLRVLRENFSDAQIIMMVGNHEERFFRYLLARCPDLIGIEGADGKPLLDVARIIHADQYGIRVLPERRPILAGEHLYMVHGHEWGETFTNPVNPARGLYLKSKVNAICGHLHQPSQHSEAGLDKVLSCWSSGCLCNLHPRYRPINKWSHGFSVVELDGDAWQVGNHKIINGNVV